MNMRRIYAIILRHLIPTFRDGIRITDIIYWPLVDITLFGSMAIWSQEQVNPNSTFVLGLLTCIACWYLVQRPALEIARNILIEIWENNLTHLFATPLTSNELIVGLMALGFIQALITFIYSLGVIWLMYGKNIFALIPALAPFIILFICFGWIIGFLVSGIIFLFGKNIETIAWSMPWLFAIITGAFYPITLYPIWLQRISYCLPATYLFEGIRAMIIHGQSSTQYLITGFLLTIAYGIITYSFFIWTVSRGKQRGLNQLS